MQTTRKMEAFAGKIMERQASKASLLRPCKFCQLLSKPDLQASVDMPWLSNEHYVAIVSIGALVPGWSLICPSSHQLNLATLYNSKDFWRFASEAYETLSDKYGSVCLFEHGACAEESLTGCGIDHAHMHLVPLPFSLEEEASDYDPSRTWIRCQSSEVEKISQGQEYLFVADSFKGESTEGLITLLEEGTSQFFRKVIAKKLGLSEKYNYRHHPMLDIAESSAKALRATKENWPHTACAL